jgi:hypothetical protein
MSRFALSFRPRTSAETASLAAAPISGRAAILSPALTCNVSVGRDKPGHDYHFQGVALADYVMSQSSEASGESFLDFLPHEITADEDDLAERLVIAPGVVWAEIQ